MSETEPRQAQQDFEKRLEEFDNDPRVMATDAQMKAEGFIMKPGTVYDLTGEYRMKNLIDLA